MQQVFQANGCIHIPIPKEPHMTYWYNPVTKQFWMDDCLRNKDEPIQQVTDSVKLVMLERFKNRVLREKTFCVIS